VLGKFGCAVEKHWQERAKRRSDMSEAVVILIFVHKPQLEWYEEISLRQCVRVLGKHPMRLVCPEGLDLAAYRAIVPEIRADFIPRHWLESIRAYNRLKILPWLYRRYAKFDYMLTYELDAFVFRDELLHWCAQGWDYVGAPWFKDHKDDTSEGFWKVGNSGFSLRRVSTCRKVLRSHRLLASPIELGWSTSLFPASPGLRFLVKVLKTALCACGYRNTMRYFATHFAEYEDIFWSFHAKRAVPGFKIPTPEEALRFSFEFAPRYCFEKNGRRLPFGCHAWHKTDPTFWREVLATQPELPGSLSVACGKGFTT
jgi:hypothetical protein